MVDVADCTNVDVGLLPLELATGSANREAPVADSCGNCGGRGVEEVGGKSGCKRRG